METLTVHLGLDELVNHATLLADKSDRHCQVNWWTYRPRVVRRFWWKALSQFTFRRRSW